MSARVLLTPRLPDLLADDRTLLARFVEWRDEAAFAALVRRHGGMILGVCRRAVCDFQLAEDAFQAVFLVLARNPAAAAKAASVGGWLFGIARRVGLAARRHELHREKHVTMASPDRQVGGSSPDWDDLLRVLDEELAALPAEYRDPLLACFLREQTHDEAARQLGWSLSTLRRRLDRGKALLRARLTRRGATLSAGMLAPSTALAVPTLLAEAVTRTALGEAPASALTSTLAAGALGASLVGKLAVALGVLLVAGAAIGFSTDLASRDRERPEVLPAREAASGLVVAPAPAREWVTLTGQVVFPGTGDVPKPLEVAKKFAIKDKDYCLSAGPLVFENVLIDPQTRGIKNAVVWLRPDDEDRKAPFPKHRIHPTLAAAEPTTHTVTIACCQFEPRVTVARAGDRVEFTNLAKVAHNVYYSPPVPAGARDLDMSEAERVFNVLVPEGRTHTAHRPLPAQRVPDHFKCNIHSWMEGYVWAFDHPYAAVTDGHGRFRIPNAPAGRWRLVVWHEAVGYRDGQAKPLGRLVTVADDAATTDLGAITFDSGNWTGLNQEE